jgi:hypothetical protein
VKHTVSLVILLGLSPLLPGCRTSKPPANWGPNEARAYFEVLRSDFHAGKVRALNDVMKLQVAEADKFWPIFRSYENELAPVSDRKLALIREFLTSRKAGTLTEDKAKELAIQWLQNAQDRLDLWKKYNQEISDNVSPIRAAQFLQVENQMGLFIDISIASEMPIAGRPPEKKK